MTPMLLISALLDTRAICLRMACALSIKSTTEGQIDIVFCHLFFSFPHSEPMLNFVKGRDIDDRNT